MLETRSATIRYPSISSEKVTLTEKPIATRIALDSPRVEFNPPVKSTRAVIARLVRGDARIHRVFIAYPCIQPLRVIEADLMTLIFCCIAESRSNEKRDSLDSLAIRTLEQRHV